MDECDALAVQCSREMIVAAGPRFQLADLPRRFGRSVRLDLGSHLAEGQHVPAGERVPGYGSAELRSPARGSVADNIDSVQPWLHIVILFGHSIVEAEIDGLAI